MSSTALAPQENLKQIRVMLSGEAIQHQIEIALSEMQKWVSPEKLVRVALTTIQGDYKLMQCDPVSVVGSVIQLAQVGLVPDGFLGQAYLVPFYNNRKKCLEAKPIIGYRGYGELAIRSGKATSVDAHVVYAGDGFDYEYGANPYLKHKPQIDPAKRGAPIGAYAVVFMKEGPHRFEVMPLDAILKIQAESKGADSDDSPWKRWWDEMARKTPLRKLAKWVPLSPEFQMAAGIDEISELGTSRAVVDAGTGQVFVVPEGHPTESAPAIERPKAVEGKQATPAASAKTCVCSCCKDGKCICKEKAEFDRCGCAPCVESVKFPEAKKEEHPADPTPAQQNADPGNAPAQEDIFGDSKTEPETNFRTDVKKLMAISKSAYGAKDYEAKVHEVLKSKFGIDSLRKIPKEKYDEICEFVGKSINTK